MLIAVPVFRSRISPVFDVAQILFMVDVEDGVEGGRRELSLSGLRPKERSALLEREGVDLLICGAITRFSQHLVERAGIRIHAGVAGDVEQVLNAFCQNRLDQACFRMPGCCRRRGQRGRGGRFIDR